MTPDLVATASAVQAAGPHQVKRMPRSYLLVFVLASMGLALMALAYKLFPGIANIASSANGGRRIGALIVAAPIGTVIAIAYLVIRGWYERGTYQFDFPLVVSLPGWGVWSSTPQMLVLARRRSTAFLFSWPVAMEPSQVLDALDPAHRFTILEDDAPTPGVLELELSGHIVQTGQLRSYGDQAFVLLLGPSSDQEMLDDVVETYLPRIRSRVPSDRVQRWRPLANPVVATARVVR